MSVEHDVEEAEGFVERPLMLVGHLDLAEEQDREADGADAGVEGAAVELEALVDDRSGSRICGVEGRVFTVGTDQVGRYGAALPQDEVAVYQCRNRVLRINLKPKNTLFDTYSC